MITWSNLLFNDHVLGNSNFVLVNTPLFFFGEKCKTMLKVMGKSSYVRGLIVGVNC